MNENTSNPMGNGINIGWIGWPPILARLAISVPSSLQAEFCDSRALLTDYATGDPVTRISGGVGFHIVRFGVNDKRRAAIGQQ